MSGAEGIDDRQSLRAWLGDRPGETALLVASRAALRVIPLFWSRVASRSRRNDLAELATCRLLLVPAVAATGSTARLRAAAQAARDSRAADAVARAAYAASRAAPGTRAAAYAAEAARAVACAASASGDATLEAAADAAADAARAAADAAASSFSAEAADGDRDVAYASAFAAAHAAFWRTTRRDCLALEAGEEIWGHPLWPGGGEADWAWAVHPGWRDRGGAWSFWADWYEGHLTGMPLGLGLLGQIALIPAPEWDAGDEHVNGIIDRAYDDYLAGVPATRGRGVARLAPPSAAEDGEEAEDAAEAGSALLRAVDGLEAMIRLQIGRLGARQHPDGADRDEEIRLLGVFEAMAEAVGRLRALIPGQTSPDSDDRSGAGVAPFPRPGCPDRDGGG